MNALTETRACYLITFRFLSTTIMRERTRKAWQTDINDNKTKLEQDDDKEL